MRFAGNKIFVVLASVLVGANAFGAVELGIEVLESPRAADPGLGALQFTFSEYRSGAAGGSSLHIHPTAGGNLTPVNIYAPAEINRQLRTNLVTRSTRGNAKCFSNAAAVRQSLPSFRPYRARQNRCELDPRCDPI